MELVCFLLAIGELFSGREQSTHSASAAHSCVLLLVSEISKKFTPTEKIPWTEQQAESCWMSRSKNTSKELFICKAYSWSATSRSELRFLAVYGSAAHSSEAMSPSGKFPHT